MTELGAADTAQPATRGKGTDAQTTYPWLRQSYLELTAMASAVPCARGHVRLVLVEWGLPQLAGPTEQVVSELMTNAVAATYGLVGSRFGGRWSTGVPPVRLWLAADTQQVVVQVWDGSDRMPEPKDLDPDAEHGRGLWLVEALSEDWGAFRPAHASGKVTWAAVAKS
jgi:Histidine kinase-like ATPase domain